jgi:RNA polymerase sigma-70 factor, ECF subfamily
VVTLQAAKASLLRGMSVIQVGCRLDALNSNNCDADERATNFMRLVRQHERQWKVYAISLLPNWADADDILQDTKLELWERFGEYDPTGNFAAWARKIIFFRVMTFRTKSGRERARFSQEAFDVVAAEAANVANETDARFDLLASCLMKLTDSARQLLRHCYASGVTIKDVATHLGRSIRGTQQRVAKIRSDLQQCIEREMRKEEHP